MAERATVLEGVQIGVESTPGTAVAANKSPSTMKIELGIKSDVEEIRQNRGKFVSTTAQGREWSEGKISGQPSYEELQIPFCGLLKNVSPSTVDTTGRSWVFKPSMTAEDAIKTYTIEQGSAFRAHKVAYGLFNSFGLKLDRKKIEMSGSLIAQRLTDSITLTSSPTEYAIVPVLPKEWSIFLDSTLGGIGTTKLTRVFAADFSFSNRYNPIWPVDAAKDSFAAHVEMPIEVKVKLMAQADAEGMALLDRLRDGQTRYLRMKATSSRLAGAATAPYSLQIDGPVQVISPNDFSDNEGANVIEWEMSFVYDATFASAIEVTLVNKQSAI